jgi:hypothetical protein
MLYNVKDRRNKMAKSPLEGLGTRTVLAAVEGFRSVTEGFTKCLDTYKAKHDASEKEEEGGWLFDFPKNALKAMDDLLRGVANAPANAVNKFLENN